MNLETCHHLLQRILITVQTSIDMHIMHNSIINLSSTLPATLSKLMGRCFETSLLSTFTGFAIGTMLDFFFPLSWKSALFKAFIVHLS